MPDLIEEYSQEAARDVCVEEWDEIAESQPEEGQKRNIAAKKREMYKLFDSEREKKKRYRVVYNPETASVRFEAGKVPAVSADTDLEEKFRVLADRWRRETGHYSLTFKRAMHPAYQQIIGMGRDAVPFILRDLHSRPTGHWFWALNAIIDENPAQLAEDIDDAIQAWLQWGREHGHL